MVKTTIGDRQAIISNKAEVANWEILIDKVADKSESELEAWFLDQFGSIQEPTRSGLKIIVKATWANAKISKMVKNKIRLG